MISRLRNPLIRRVQRHGSLSMLFRAAEPASTRSAVDASGRDGAGTTWIMGHPIEPASQPSGSAAASRLDHQHLPGVPALSVEATQTTHPQDAVTTSGAPVQQASASAQGSSGVRAALRRLVQPFSRTAPVPQTDAPRQTSVQAKPVQGTPSMAGATRAGVSDQEVAALPAQHGREHRTVEEQVLPSSDLEEDTLAGTPVAKPAAETGRDEPDWDRLTAIMRAHERLEGQAAFPEAADPSLSALERTEGAAPMAREVGVSDGESVGDAAAPTEPAEVQAMPGSDKAESERGLDDPGQPSRSGTPTRLPLQDVWPVQRVAQRRDHAPQGEPARGDGQAAGANAPRADESWKSVSAEPGGGARDDIGAGQTSLTEHETDEEKEIVQADDIDVDAVLRQAQPARTTESDIHIITPRRRPPVQMQRAEEPTIQGQADVAVERTERTIPTEAGDLPADLWGLIDEPPPEAPHLHAVPNEASSTRPLQRNAENTMPNAPAVYAVVERSFQDPMTLHAEVATTHAPALVPERPNQTTTDAVMSSSPTVLPADRATTDVTLSGPTTSPVQRGFGASASAQAQPHARQIAPVAFQPAPQRPLASVGPQMVMRADEDGETAEEAVVNSDEVSDQNYTDEPDVSVLARQVYAQIRRRLVVDWERTR